uniref:Nonstructural protein 1 n=1 Tax=Emberiza spodocephala ambidensovirus TaxID=2794446 RepID=A0A8A4XD80_9VIRU|nr:MAG: nonstructural protein 1 [Emberiza spodocephala ambidensovirus]
MGINMADGRTTSIDNCSVVGDSDGNVSSKIGSTHQTHIENYITTDKETSEEGGIGEVISFIRGFSTALSGERLLHDVIPNISRSQADYFSQRCLGKKFSNGVFALTWHTDHLHVLHDCNYAGGKCRCARIQCLPIKSRSRRHLRAYLFDECYAFNISKYFLQPPRSNLYIEISGRRRTIPSQIGTLSYQRYCELGEEPVVEECAGPNEFLDCEPGRPPAYPSSTSHSKSSSSNKGVKRRRQGGSEEELLEWIRHFPASPILNIVNSTLWLQSPYKFMRRSDPMISTVTDVMSLEIINYSFLEMYEYAKSVSPLYAAYKMNVSDYYLSQDESLSIMNTLLSHQFNDDLDTIRQFLTDLYNILDKRLPKVNAMQIISPPSAGKNFFFDAVIHFFFAYGQIGNFNKFNNFPLQECINKRILLWNEPNIEPSAVDTLKMLFGGDAVNAKIKYQADAVISRTPIVILSNKSVFPNDAAFQCRMITYHWTAAPFLKEVDKKIYPLSLHDLFKQYDII